MANIELFTLAIAVIARCDGCSVFDAGVTREGFTDEHRSNYRDGCWPSVMPPPMLL